jgi:hypothetical protein
MIWGVARELSGFGQGQRRVIFLSQDGLEVGEDLLAESCPIDLNAQAMPLVATRLPTGDEL